MMDKVSYHGAFQGVISAVDDPDKRGRVKVKLPDLFFDPESREVIDSPWCEAKGNWGEGTGWFGVPPVGSPVWVTVRYSDDGEIYTLVYEPGRFGAADGKAHAPAVAKGEDDDTVTLKPTTADGKASTPFSVPAADYALPVPGLRPGKTGELRIDGIPGSANAGEYPKNRVFKSPGGIVVELDDTPGAARVHLWHPEGTSVEVNDAGVWVQRQTKHWEETVESKTVYTGGDHRERTNGNRQLSVGLNHVESAGGRRVVLASELHVQTRVHALMEFGGRFNLKVRGHATEKFISGKNTSIGGDNSVSWVGEGNFISGGNVQAACFGNTTLASMKGVNVLVAPGAAGGLRVGPVPIPPGGEVPFSLVHSAALSALLETMVGMLVAHTHPVAGQAAGPSAELVAMLATVQGMFGPLPTTSLFAV